MERASGPALLYAAQNHGGILAADGDAVGYGVLDLQLASHIGDAVEIALRVGFVHVDGGGHDAIAWAS